ncbi:hypothetical protein [Synechococcus sp. PCC 6312]|uniref:hypothetical protein n=1 Tax=Synechococcus sp. (strain ATCC 27167 / PCC 6312) TaxID=195253 RepID=UPI00029F24D3|nr:hypothetical protein [Synechococcus sp. PCC 6312]AFY60524.1 hypothetical protein Syn6312_1352 [Synechococcus sp. PCC 6312]
MAIQLAPVLAVGQAVAIGAVAGAVTNTLLNAQARAWKKGRDANPGQQPNWYTDFGDTVWDYNREKNNFPPIPANSFIGGQCSIAYKVGITGLSTKVRTLADGSKETTREVISLSPNDGVTAQGPIQSVFLESSSTGNSITWNLVVIGANGRVQRGLGQTLGFDSFVIQLSGTQIVPVSGIDNCGNLTFNNTINNYYYNTTNNNTINLPDLPSVEIPELPSFELPKFEPYQTTEPLTDLSDPERLPEYEDADINEIKNNLDIALDRLTTLLNNQDSSLEAILDAVNNIRFIQPGEDDEPLQPGETLIPITITVPWVREDVNGERYLEQQTIKVVSNPSALISRLTATAEMALDPIRTEMAKKLFLIMGGETFWEFETIDGNLFAKAQYNPEEYLRDTSELSYNIQESNGSIATLESRELISRSLPSLITAINSVNYIRSGQWKYPTTVPDTIVERDENTLLPFTIQQIELHDIQDYNEWFLQQFDEILGNWHNRIEIEDNDLVAEGNQSQTIVLHSVADALSEILTQNVTTNVLLKAIINLNTRNLIETINTKKESVVANYAIDTIIDYLACEIKQKTIKLPMLATLPTTEGESSNIGLSDFLKDSEKDIAITEYSGKQNLQFSLTSLLQGAAIVKASLTRKLPGSLTDFISQVMQQVNGFESQDNTQQLIDQIKDLYGDDVEVTISPINLTNGDSNGTN